jgi:cytidylate kinase
LAEVRHHIVERQRVIGIGSAKEFGGGGFGRPRHPTVVFPDADLKYSHTLRPTRARNALCYSGKKQQNGDLDDALRDILERDERDSRAPLRHLKPRATRFTFSTDEMSARASRRADCGIGAGKDETSMNIGKLEQ